MVRQKPAKLLPPVRIWVPPNKGTEDTNVESVLLFFKKMPYNGKKGVFYVKFEFK